MKRTLLLLCLALPQSFLASAQEQPPVHFPPGYNVCDPAPYQLVFDEEFDGNSVDYSKWVSWGTYDGGYGDDNWSDSRWDDQGGKTIIRDENVIVGGGIARLQVYHSAQSWKCDTCLLSQLHTANYSSGYLTTKFSQHYNNGRFESRIKFPKSDHMWSTMWTYHGYGDSGINEIDIAEANGGPLTAWGQNNYTLSHSTHVQKLKVPYLNPYNLQDGNKTTHYPHCDWWDIVNGTFFDMDHWHTYACEWDTALVSTYLDGSLIYQEPKYYYNLSLPVYKTILFFTWQVGSINVYHPAICNTDPGQLYHINTVFPYNTKSQSILKFTTQMDEDMTPKSPGHPPLTGSTLVGEMQIDYARIWQRHPEQDNHTNLCSQSHPIAISGPNIVCTTATYTASASPNIPAGNWAVSSNLNIISQSNTATSSTIVVQKAANSTSSYGTVSYSSADAPACPGGVATKQIDVGQPRQFSVNIVATKMFSGLNCFYNLFATNPYPHSSSSVITNSPTTYKWDIWYGGGFSNHLVATGQHYSTPIVPYTPGYGGVQGSLTITNSCGSTVILIHKDNSHMKGTADSSSSESNIVNYFNAEITDTAAFRLAVEGGIQSQFVADTVAGDTSAVTQIIEQSITRALAPYLLIDTNTIHEGAKAGRSTAAQNDATSVYPNPTNGEVNILLGAQFDLSAPALVSISDLYGRQLYATELHANANGASVLSMSGFVPGVYSISIKQATIARQFLITRQ